jgi:hypothetical protein
MYLVGTAAWVWLVILGIWMLVPNAGACIGCGTSLNYVVAIFSVLLGVGGLISRYVTSFQTNSLPHTH